MLIGLGCVMSGLLVFKILMVYPPAIYAAIIIFTIGEIVTHLATSPFLSRRIPANYRGRIGSINSVITSIMTALFTMAFGHIYDSAGSNVTWLCVYVIGILGIAAIICLSRIDRKDYPGLYK